MLDESGYFLVEKSFKIGGFQYDFIEDLGENWFIYSQKIIKFDKIIAYELVKLTRSEEYIIAGNAICKRWSYPGSNAFGKSGFSCCSVERCKEKLKELQVKQEEKDNPSEIIIPINEEFTIKELVGKLGIKKNKLLLHLKQISNKLKVVREIKNKSGMNTKVYILPAAN